MPAITLIRAGARGREQGRARRLHYDTLEQKMQKKPQAWSRRDPQLPHTDRPHALRRPRLPTYCGLGLARFRRNRARVAGSRTVCYSATTFLMVGAKIVREFTWRPLLGQVPHPGVTQAGSDSLEQDRRAVGDDEPQVKQSLGVQILEKGGTHGRSSIPEPKCSQTFGRPREVPDTQATFTAHPGTPQLGAAVDELTRHPNTSRSRVVNPSHSCPSRSVTWLIAIQLKCLRPSAFERVASMAFVRKPRVNSPTASRSSSAVGLSSHSGPTSTPRTWRLRPRSPVVTLRRRARPNEHLMRAGRKRVPLRRAPESA